MGSKGTAKRAPAEFGGRVYDNIVEKIGATPLVRIHRLARDASAKADILGKCEVFNPLASVKERIGVSMIAAAVAAGGIKPATVLVEPTSGNTGIALAFVCAAKGYQLTLTMPDSMSLERRKMLKLLGAELQLTRLRKACVPPSPRPRRLSRRRPTLSSPSSSATRRTPTSTATRPQRRSGTTPAARLISW
jgi:cysteine synthase